MLNKITAFIERHQLLRHDGGKYIVALSGGADSVALLLVMKQLGYDVEAAHCNFHLRGEESDRDEQFVCDLCKSNEIPLHLIHFDTNTYAELHQVSVEMAARELRYRYFEQLRQDIGAEDVCVAHHEDDAVEMVMRMYRNCELVLDASDYVKTEISVKK
jgi:tRNA(Ile)-lysidine synthase